MRFALAPEQVELREAIRGAFGARGRPAPLAAPPELDAAGWRRAAAQGLVGLGVPERLGGQGAGAVELMVLLHEAGRALVPEPYLGTAGLALPLLLALGGDDALVASLASGEQAATLALHEPGRADPLDPATAVSADGTVTGRKRAVPDAAAATVFLVVARDDAGIGVYAVRRADATVGDGASIDLTRSWADVDLAGAPAERVWSGADPEPLRRALDVAGVLAAAELVGAAERCVELAVEYAKTRYQFGRPIGSFQATKHRCVDMFVELELARAAVEYAAWTVGGRPDELAIAAPVAQAAAAGAATFVTQEAIHVHGGIGFTWEHEAHLYLRRVRALAAFLGNRDRPLRALVERSGWAAR